MCWWEAWTLRRLENCEMGEQQRGAPQSLLCVPFDGGHDKQLRNYLPYIVVASL